MSLARFRTSPQPSRAICSSEEPDEKTLEQRTKFLRKNMTSAERILWAALRQSKPAGFHFRRQAPFDPYILDFVCHRAKLVVEVDGSQHATPEEVERDAKRTAFLNSQGYRVLRYWSVDAMTNSREIAGAIYQIGTSRLARCNNNRNSVSPPPCGEVEIAQRFRVGAPARLAHCDVHLADFSARRPPHEGEVEDEVE